MDPAVRLADPRRRAATARDLASYLGAVELLLMLRDPELDVLLPAPGFPQTLPGGPAWPDFLGQCTPGARVKGRLPLPVSGELVEVWACGAEDGTVLLLLGGAPRVEDAAPLCQLLPLLAAAFQGELAERTAAGHAAAAREAAAQARGLAETLDVARKRLQAALQEAQEADRRKDEFLAMLAHELRNPLAPIQSAIEVLRNAGPPDPILQRNRDIIARQAAQLARLVDDLLDVSRITQGKINLRRCPVDLTELVEQAVEASRPLIEARRHTLSLSRELEELCINADSSRIIQVVSNLLTNAAKYTEPGGTIRLVVAR